MTGSSLPDLSVELVPLARLEVTVGTVAAIGPAPAGQRTVVEVTGAHFEGDRISAELFGGAAGDWLTLGPDGTTTLDVRLTLKTDDDVLIHMRYGGRSDRTAEAPYNYVSALFETADPRYRWLNAVQAVGKGIRVAGSAVVLYDFYEVR
jgi:hypothetical protein